LAAVIVATATAVLPSLLCCTLVVPTLLSAAGLSEQTSFDASFAVARLFGVHQQWFLAAGLVGLAWSAWAGRRRSIRVSGCRVAALPAPPRG
jgi:hypothetical protein